MSSATLTAGTVMNASAALLNDVQKQQYTFAAQIPYLNIALQELQEIFEQNDVAVTVDTSVEITIPVGYDHIAYDNGVNPSLPSDFIEPQKVWEKANGSDSYVPMTRVGLLPLHRTSVGSFSIYIWAKQEIRFPISTRINDIKIDYIRNLFPPVVDQNSGINVVNAATFLEFRNAALCAEFIGENKSRADSLNNDAGLAVDRSLGINSKGGQAIITRRLPFRSGYKSRGGR